MREGRLWSWAFLILVAILVAAVFAGALVAAVPSEAVLGVAFAGGLAMAVVAVLGIALDRKRSPDVWIVVGVLAALVMIPVRTGVTALERTHLFEFGLLAVVVYEALTERRRNAGGVPLPGLAAICLTAVVGWLDEALQALVPGRVYDLRDVGINALAALVTVSVVAAIRWARGVGGRS